MKEFEKNNEKSQFEHLQEMAAVGEIQSSKAGHFYIEIFSREYKTEIPHATLLAPQRNGKQSLVKIEIPNQQPNLNDEPNFFWIREDFTISNSLKKEIQNWFVEKDKRGLTGWEKASMYWEDQSKSVSWGQLQK